MKLTLRLLFLNKTMKLLRINVQTTVSFTLVFNRRTIDFHDNNIPYITRIILDPNLLKE